MRKNANHDNVRLELLLLLEGGNAHMTFAEVTAAFPPDQAVLCPPNTPYSFWHFAEHIRIAQWDILEFIRNPHHISPDYPMGYRPPVEEKATPGKWDKSVADTLADLEELKHLVQAPDTDLFAPLPHASDYTIFREILTVAAHNSYHIGELAVLRQVTGLWPKGMEYLTGKAD